MVLSNNIYSPQNFLEVLTDKCFIVGDCPIEDIHEILIQEGIENKCDCTLWDYPLSEIDEIVANELNVVLVYTSGFDDEDNWVEECRWFEVPDYLTHKFTD